jgi:S-formylglutathione hydrolase FrmB
MPRRLSAALVLLGAALALVAPAQAADPRLVRTERLSPRLQELTLRTSDLAEATKVRVLLPAGYEKQRQRRYAVLYLLHGASGDQTSWTTLGNAAALTAKLPLIVVMPDGGRGGFYTDWFNNGKGGLPRWESWHIGRLIPYVDGRYRTIADRRGRAIAGLSMGGFGTFSYAARHPDLFTAALSLSGAVDQALVPGLIDGISSLSGGTPGSLWGPFETQELRWRAHDPLDLAENLRGLALWLRTGNGQPGGPLGGGAPVDAIEAGVAAMTLRVHQRLRQLRIPHVYDNYGAGQHIWPYWSRGLSQTLPGIMARFRAAPRPPARVTYKSAEDVYAIYGWSVRLARRAAEFSRLANAGRRGFTLAGSGKASVTTPPLFRPRAPYRITLRGKSTYTRRADRGGQLRLDVPLGPANPIQQYQPDSETRVYTTRVTIKRR